MPIKPWVKGVGGNVKAPITKWKTKVKWKGCENAADGDPADIVLVRGALELLQNCLQEVKGKVPQAANDYLQNCSKKNDKLFKDVVDGLLKRIQGYLGTGSEVLYVASQVVPGALASSKPAGESKWKKAPKKVRNPENPKSTNLIIIHDAFSHGYKKENKWKTPTPWGQAATVLHELTHSLLETYDVWFHDGQYGVVEENQEKYARFAITTEEQCKKLAEVSDSKIKAYKPHISYLNAENWTRAIIASSKSYAKKAQFKYK